MSIMMCDICGDLFDSDYVLPTCTPDYSKCACENCMTDQVEVAIEDNNLSLEEGEALKWYLKHEV